tara:strand:+ start:48 stop:776 length:729 start_codon:yes stop_codon:yes gene_type:complete
MKQVLFIAIIFFSINCFSQEATFSIDTTRVRQFKKNGNYRENISALEWIINGKKLKIGSSPIKVNVTPNKLDTIYFKGYRKTKYDTILCDIIKPINYTIFYNTCCGAFNIHQGVNKKYVTGSVCFKTVNHLPVNEYIGIIGESGKKLNFSDTIKPACRSAMSPNIYPIKISQISNCTDTASCKVTCLQVNKQENPIWDYNYKEIEIITSFLYMPLTSSPLLIEFDPKSKAIFLNKKRLVTHR